MESKKWKIVAVRYEGTTTFGSKTIACTSSQEDAVMIAEALNASTWSSLFMYGVEEDQ